MRGLALLACLALASCGGGDPSCEYQGQTHARGDIFPAGDGCNTCSCTDQGVECTLLACVPDAGVGACAPAGACASGPVCGGGCCAAGEECVGGTCRCGNGAACGVGDSCAAAGPIGQDSCGSICCGANAPCPQ